MPYRFRGGVFVWLTVAVAGCWTPGAKRTYQDPPPPGVRVTRIDYVDADGFDALLESALVNQDSVIAIHTDHDRPDWDARLNAWIAAWNRGGKVEGRTARLESALLPGAPVDGDSLREFRLLIDDLMGRVEESAKAGSAWWVEERTRARRVALLKSYNLRFHIDEDGKIQIILFNGRYAPYNQEFVRSIAGADAEGAGEWVRAYQCSRCKEARQTPSGPARTEGKLMSHAAE